MSEEVLGSIRVRREAFSEAVSETLYFTPDRTVVARTSSSGWFLGGVEIGALVVGFIVGVMILYPIIRGSGILTLRGIYGSIAGFGFGVMFSGIALLIVWAIAEAIRRLDVKKKEEEYSRLSQEDIVKAHKDNYAIPNSEIKEVELKKSWRGTKLNIKTSRKDGEIKWIADGAWKDVGKRFENMLRPIFKDRLIVRSEFS